MRPVGHEAGIAAWAESGAMNLCGRQDRPFGPPARLVATLRDVAIAIAKRTATLGHRVSLNPLPLLTERAATCSLTRHGTTSCGGATRLLHSADEWLAVSLVRPDDVELLPAWLGIDASIDPEHPWPHVESAVAHRTAAVLEEAAVELGLPVTRVASVTREDGPAVRRSRKSAAPPRSLVGLRVVDLSSLWAGPLCTRILADAGAEVVKVESTTRPDGARRGATSFFDLMNAGKKSVAVDFTSEAGRVALEALISTADVVVEASRPRALEGLGMNAAPACGIGSTGVAVDNRVRAHRPVRQSGGVW